MKKFPGRVLAGKKLQNTAGREMNVRGSITIYMVLSVIIVLVLVFTVIESARVTAAGAKLRGITYMAMDSVFSEYARPVFEDYGVMMLWCKTKEFADRFEGYARDNAEYGDYSAGIGTDLFELRYGSALLSETTKITDKNGEPFKKQVVDYMKNFILEEAAEEILSGTKIFEQAGKVSGLMDKLDKCRNVFKKVETAVGKVKEKISKVKEKVNEPLAHLNQMKTALSSFADGEDPARDLFYRALGNLKTCRSELESRLDSVKRETDSYYEKVDEAQKEIATIEEDVDISAGDFEPDVYEAVEEELNDIKAKSGEANADYYNVGSAGDVAESLKNSLASLDGLFEAAGTDITEENVRDVKAAVEAYEQSFAAIDFDSLYINYDDTETAKEPSGFIDEINGILSNGILEYVAPELSDKSIDLAELPSKTVKHEKALSDSALEKVQDKVLLAEYVKSHFGRYTEPKEGTPLAYEAEYIISGKKSDKAALKDVADGIIAMRAGLNMISMLKDGQKKAECLGLAAALVGFTGLPVLIKIMQVVLMGTWSLAEAIVDCRTLLKGEKVPIIKGNTEWCLSLTNVRNFAGSSFEGISAETGFSYEDYLRIMLIGLDETEMSFRAMDMIQANMAEKENEDFRISDCISDATIQAEYKVPKVFISFGIVKQYMRSDGNAYTFTISQKYGY